MRRRKRICWEGNCPELAAVGQYCSKHYEKHEVQRRLRDRAVDALHAGVDSSSEVRTRDLVEEFRALQRWWYRACDGVNYKRSHDLLPLDEAPYAVEWCIALAVELLEAMRCVADGTKPLGQLDATRAWVWDRFWNLEQGLASNGRPRREIASAPGHRALNS